MKAKRKTASKGHQPGVVKGPKGSRIPRGYGAMRDMKLDLDPRIDLTKPIYRQVLNLEKAAKTAPK